MKKTPDAQIRHLSQAVQLEEAVNPAILRTTMAIIGATILAFTIWSAFTNINEVARTPGEVIPNGYQQVVQHLEGGIVGKINVVEGDLVEKDQLLLRLDGTGITEDLERAIAKKTSLEMQEERLRAYIEKRAPDFSRISGADEQLIRDQTSFFESMERTNEQDKQVVLEQIEQKKRSRISLAAELSTARKNRSISARLFESRKTLREKGYLSETRYLEARQALNSIEGEIAVIESRLSVVDAEIKEFTNRLNSLSFAQNDRVNERLDIIIAERRQHEEILRKLEEKSHRLAVRAPVSGIVKGLAVNTVGAVVMPGETLMEIVPMDGDLVVQVKIPPQHIGHLKIGQAVKVKLSSYDFARYGLIDGSLQHISATTFSGEGGERYYQGRIHLHKNYVGTNAQNLIFPGMTVMAEIITGEKTILQYLLKPIHNSFKTAFSER